MLLALTSRLRDNHPYQNNRTQYIFCNLRKIDNRNKWKIYIIVIRGKLSVELVLREQPIFIQL